MPAYDVRIVDEHGRTGEMHAISVADDFAALEAALFILQSAQRGDWRDGAFVTEPKNGAFPLDIIWTGLG